MSTSEFDEAILNENENEMPEELRCSLPKGTLSSRSEVKIVDLDKGPQHKLDAYLNNNSKH